MLCTSYAYIFLVKILNFLQIPVSSPIFNRPRHHCNANTVPATRPTQYCIGSYGRCYISYKWTRIPHLISPAQAIS